MKRYVTLATLAVSVGFGMQTTADEIATPDLTGVYRCESAGQRGTVTIRRVGETYELRWKLPGATHTGVAIREGNVLASNWGDQGIVLYQIKPGPKLVGRSSSFEFEGHVETETLTFEKPLAKQPARAWKEGDRALVHWSGNEYWYPATVQKVENDRYHVQFDDGDEEWTDASRITAENLKVGDQVYGNWKKSGTFYPGKITKREGEAIHISYDDTDQEDTTIAVVRVLRPDDE